jgi:phosphatidylserine/phosphatidylglycerophosphate/cardiolipin synthase-like enzyme
MQLSLADIGAVGYDRSMKPLTLLDGHQYHHELLAWLPRAKQRIVMAALNIAAGPRMNQVFEQLEAATARGVDVHILVDTYTKTRFGWSENDWQHQIGQVVADLKRLEQCGVRVSWVGPTREINPFAHRCHLKMTIIDDRIYSFGGINLTDGAFEVVDYMTVTTNQAAAGRLVQAVEAVSRDAFGPDDVSWALNETSTVMIDAGQPGRSLIYDRACELAGQAKRVIYVSQYVPGPRLARPLRRTDTQFFYNRPGQTGFPFSTAQTVGQAVYGLRNQYQHDRYIHAKFILFEMADDSKTSLAGSHNFSAYGVMFGTKEIALESKDESLWQQLYQFWSNNLK